MYALSTTKLPCRNEEECSLISTEDVILIPKMKEQVNVYSLDVILLDVEEVLCVGASESIRNRLNCF